MSAASQPQGLAAAVDVRQRQINCEHVGLLVVEVQPNECAPGTRLGEVSGEILHADVDSRARVPISQRSRIQNLDPDGIPGPIVKPFWQRRCRAHPRPVGDSVLVVVFKCRIALKIGLPEKG